jgi:hypothetical protein
VEANRKYDPMVSFQGLQAKGGGRFTTGQTLLRANVRIIPWDVDQQLDILSEILNVPDGLSDRDVFDRTTTTSNIDIDPTYSPVEVRTVAVGSGLDAGQDAKLTNIDTLIQIIDNLTEEVHQRMDLNADKPNKMAEDASFVENDDFRIDRTDNGDGTFTTTRS